MALYWSNVEFSYREDSPETDVSPEGMFLSSWWRTMSGRLCSGSRKPWQGKG